MTEPLISLIIPVYNVEKYLDYCMKSVLAQNYTNLEIILVDDGSTDSSGKICDEYAIIDHRIKVIHKENGGLSSARNIGIETMTGEYLSFIDSDDFIRLDYVSKMYSYIIRDNSDLVVCSFKKVINDEAYDVIFPDKSQHFIFDRETTKLKMLSRQIPMYAHGKLYCVKVIGQLKFPEGKLYEDVPTNWEVAKTIERTTYITDEIYFYRQRLGSIVNAQYGHARMDQLYFAEKILGEIKEGDPLYHIAMSRCFFSAADNYTQVTKEYLEDWKYLETALKKYSIGVLKDITATKSLKVLAISSKISLKLTRIMGKMYKTYNCFKLKRKRV